ncbi:MAG: diacylglycerol/polyprenol kinase family protein [Syntrophothermus sp.]|nr:SEC59/DGK1/VTE5 family protein [Ignavibacteriaceae bacterium]
MTQIDNGTIQYRDEVVRKLIHLFSLSIPIVYYFIDKTTAIILLSILTAFALSLELLRYSNAVISKFIYKYFGFLLRKHEVSHKKKNLTGASYVLISALLCVIIFPKVIFLTAFTILIISDSAAALIGRKFGKHKFLLKSLEGTLAFFISAIIVVFITPKSSNYISTEILIGIIAAFIGAIVENVSFGWADDNLSIPLSIGILMWIMYTAYNLPLILTNVPR